uniref:Uncharacterized protein n=1 Tax=Meloidogyne hapla TaxID=6305 RepID=A0A1I8BSD5_MELHA
MNNSDVVPARIVVVGTSKLRLSERFNRIQTEKIEQQPQRQVVKQRHSSLEPQSQRHHADSVLSVNGGPIIERPRVFQRPTSGSISSNKSFLHDNYMDNELYGEFSEHEQYRPPPPQQQHLSGRFRTCSSEPFENFSELNNVNPVNLTLDDYDDYQRMRIRRPFYSSSRLHKYDLDGIDEEYDFPNNNYATRSRSNLYNDSSRRPIQQRLSFRPRMSEFALRRPIRNNFSFKRSFRGRFVGGWRAWYGGGGGGNWISGQGGGLRRNRRNDKRHKKTVAELDRELDVKINF